MIAMQAKPKRPQLEGYETSAWDTNAPNIRPNYVKLSGLEALT